VSDSQKDHEQPRPGSFWRSIKMVSWAFFGIRKNSELQEDMARVNPLHIVAVGIGLAIAFVFCLITLVQWVADK
jgi:hypothetical protein